MKNIKGQLIAGAVSVLALIVLLVGVFVLPRKVSAAPPPAHTWVTQSDAGQLFNTFVPLCNTTYQPKQDANLCVVLSRGRITPFQDGKGYCVTDWHLVSSLFIDTAQNLNALSFQVILDGTSLQTNQTPITQIDPAFSQKFYGGQFDWIQNGVVISPAAMGVGMHTLHTRVFNSTGNITDKTISFQLFPAGSITCK